MNDGKCHPSSWECVNATAEYNSTHYCDSSHKIKTKKAEDNTCTANYECQNKNCINISLADRCFDGSGEFYKQKCAPAKWECPCADSPMNDGKGNNGTYYCTPNNTIIVANLGLNILKTADKQKAKVGGNITYTIKINNTGNVPLTNITVVDGLLNWSQNIARLNASKSTTFEVNYTVKYNDLSATKYKNSDKKTKEIIEDKIDKQLDTIADNNKKKNSSSLLKEKIDLNQQQQDVLPINKIINVVIATGQFNPIISASGISILDVNSPNTTLTKNITYSSEPVKVGDEIIYNITLKNNGDIADDLTIRDMYDFKLDIINISSTCANFVGGCNTTTNKCNWNLSLASLTNCNIIIKTQTIFEANNTEAVKTYAANATSTYTNETSEVSKAQINIIYIFYRDADNDSYGNPFINTTQINNATIPSGYVRDNTDCDDSSSTIYPGSSSEDSNCNVIDDNCNGRVDENCDRGKSHTYTCYKDADNDGYGNATDSIAQTISACSSGYTTDNTDCDDSNASIHPGATEICNEVDDNCNGTIDEGCECKNKEHRNCTDTTKQGICKDGIQTCADGIWGPCIGKNPQPINCNNNLDNNCNGIIDSQESTCSTSCKKTTYEICTYANNKDVNPKCVSQSQSASFLVCVATYANIEEIAEKAVGQTTLFSIKAESSAIDGWWKVGSNIKWESLYLGGKFYINSVNTYNIKLNKSCGGENYCKVSDDSGECGVMFTITSISCICGDGICGINEDCPKDCKPKTEEIGGDSATTRGGTISAGELQQLLEQQRAFLCGNRICDLGVESCRSCPSDCGDCSGSYCGDGKCDYSVGESCKTCTVDCGFCKIDGKYCGDGKCDYSVGESCKTCTVDCGFCKIDGKYCGDGICDEDEKSFCVVDCGTDGLVGRDKTSECDKCNYLIFACIPNTLAWILLLIFTLLSTFFAYLLIKKKANFSLPISFEDLKSNPKQAIANLFEKENIPYIAILLAVLIVPLIAAIIISVCLLSQIIIILALVFGAILGALSLIEKIKERGGIKEFINNKALSIGKIKDALNNTIAKLTKKGVDKSTDKTASVLDRTKLITIAASALASKGIKVSTSDLVASQFDYQSKQHIRVLTKDKKHEIILDLDGKVLRVI